MYQNCADNYDDSMYHNITNVEGMKAAIISDVLQIRDRYVASRPITDRNMIDGLIMALEVMRDLFNTPEIEKYMKRPHQLPIMKVAIEELLRQYAPENRN